MDEHMEVRYEKPTGILAYDHILTKEERAEVSKMLQDYDGSMPFDRYLEGKKDSFHVEFINFMKEEGEP